NSAIVRLLACAAGLLSAAVAEGQTKPPSLNLAKPDWTAEDAFSDLPSIRQLSNGSVIATDLKDVQVRLLSANGTTLKQLGRRGSGPSEYTKPTALLALSNDTTLLLDRDARRILTIDPSGKFTSTQPIPTRLGTGSERLAYADRQGRIFFQSETPTEDGVNASSTNAIARWTRPRDAFDTVALIKMEVQKVLERKMPNNKEVLIMNGVYRTSYGPADDWVATATGRAAIIHAEPYHVEWIETNRTRTIGATVAFPPVPVTDADKKYYEPNGPPYVRLYAKTKSPFVTRSAIVDESENIWVRRYEPIGSATRRWDVFDAKGKHLGTVPISADRQLLAINKAYAYCARTDNDGLVWLERYSR
ncbi:MAG: hypothetical protein ABI120_02190, partial [Gemmatimonadaceae bacterium]